MEQIARSYRDPRLVSRRLDRTFRWHSQTKLHVTKKFAYYSALGFSDNDIATFLPQINLAYSLPFVSVWRLSYRSIRTRSIRRSRSIADYQIRIIALVSIKMFSFSLFIDAARTVYDLWNRLPRIIITIGRPLEQFFICIFIVLQYLKTRPTNKCAVK